MKGMKRWVFPSRAVLNMRDLGGYMCEGGVTKYGVVLRSDQPIGLSEGEIRMLKECGLTDVIDLRSTGERNERPGDFCQDPDVTVHTITISHETNAMQFSPDAYSNMGQMYCEMVDANACQYTGVVRTIAAASGMSLVHCFAGKDRTGIICSLILQALGVEDADVVADYQVSETYQNMEQDAKYFAENPQLPRYLTRSESSNMWMLIAHLNERHGGALCYLKSHGLTDAELGKLRARMVEPVTRII